MADITLSKAVRSNLLSLQNTSSLLAKTQERLATGLRVNSALDNPTNFFTASSLNSRANDLGRLLDSISNANQTIEAADNGLTAITKLVESAQATARQALQTSATIETTTAATSASLASSSFSALDLSGAGSAATNATTATSSFAAVDLTNAGSAGSQSLVTAASTFTDIDLTNDAGDALTFDVDLGGTTVSITLDRAGDTANGGVGAGVDNTYTIDEAIAEINVQLTAAGLGVTAGKDGLGTSLTFTADNPGATALTVDNVAVVDGGGVGSNVQAITDLGISNPGTTGQTDTGAAVVLADSISFDLTVGSTTQSITLDSTITNASGATSATDIANAINSQFGSNVASVVGGELTFTDSSQTGTSSVVTIANYTESGNASLAGLGNGTNNGSAAVAADTLTFDLTVGSTTQSITLDNSITASDNSAVTASELASAINTQFGSTVASVVGGELTFTDSTTGTGSTVTIANLTAGGNATTSGLSNGTDSGSAASTSTTVNPKRDEFVTTYNSLLTQIDDLAKDAGFNGVNLLSGDDLSVLFNEDGSSSLDITGVTFDSSGLSLSAIASGGFDTNTGVNSTLDTLDSAIATLRAQSSTFGSNLSVVETRQNFTKSTINTLETGAANLTLADSNEEAANLLALQTRQQLSSTSLSLASSADQQVLRLF